MTKKANCSGRGKGNVRGTWRKHGAWEDKPEQAINISLSLDALECPDAAWLHLACFYNWLCQKYKEVQGYDAMYVTFWW